MPIASGGSAPRPPPGLCLQTPCFRVTPPLPLHKGLGLVKDQLFIYLFIITPVGSKHNKNTHAAIGYGQGYGDNTKRIWRKPVLSSRQILLCILVNSGYIQLTAEQHYSYGIHQLKLGHQPPANSGHSAFPVYAIASQTHSTRTTFTRTISSPLYVHAYISILT